MGSFRLQPEAESDLDDIWRYYYDETGTDALANRIIDAITDRFYLLAQHPRIGRRRDDLRVGLRGFPVEGYLILYRLLDDDEPLVLIMHVLHGSRDIAGLLGR
jgi:toxin ParE1/3/4